MKKKTVITAGILGVLAVAAGVWVGGLLVSKVHAKDCHCGQGLGIVTHKLCCG